MIIPNIDTLILNIDAANYDNWMASLAKQFKKAKDKAKEQNTRFNSHMSKIKLGSIEFQIWPNGIIGKAFVLKSKMVNMDLSEFRSRKKEQYPISVRFNQEYLWSAAAEHCIQEVELWLQDIGLQDLILQVSEVHLCCHTDLINFEPYSREDFKTRSTTYAPIHKGNIVETHQFGSRDGESAFTRIYNKTKEINVTNKLWFIDVWKQNGYKDESIDVWNIEYELKRKFLKKYEIESPIDLMSSISNLWHQLTTQNVQLIERAHTRKENDHIHPEWLKVYHAFDIYQGDQRIAKVDTKPAALEALMPQLAGCATSYLLTKFPSLDLLSLGDGYMREIFSEVLKDIMIYVTRPLNEFDEVPANPFSEALNKKRNNMIIRKGLIVRGHKYFGKEAIRNLQANRPTERTSIHAEKRFDGYQIVELKDYGVREEVQSN